MKKRINAFIVVEGQADKAYLSSFLKCPIIELRGFSIPCGTFEYLKALSKHMKMIILTDPDEAGKTIAKRLKKDFPNADVISVEFTARNGLKKHGIAECEKEPILKALKPYIIESEIDTNIDEKLDEKNRQISLKNLYEIVDENHSINDIKKTLKKTYFLGECNTKIMLERLNYLGIKIDEIKGVIFDGN